jgi:localization factor PodJL
MDQLSVESLLRRLVQRVEESERRYSEALDELHARLDQISQTTDAARAAGAPQDIETFGRLHDQVSDLARRLERESSTPLDDFERLGRALAGDLDYGSGLPGVPSSTPELPGDSAFPALYPSEPPVAGPFSFPLPMPEVDYSARPFTPSYPSSDVPSSDFPSSDFSSSDRDLDSRLVEMAQQLEHSLGEAMPPAALEALNARLDEIGHQLAKALETPKTLSLEPVERQISEMAQQLGKAEAQLAKIGEIESALHQLIARVDASPAPEEMANKAAQEAARLVAEAKPSGATAERLDAMHRDLMAMNDRTRASDDRLAGTIEAVHASLKQLVQQAERGAPAPQAPKPRVPFAERVRELAPLPGMPSQQPPAEMRMEKSEAPQAAESFGSADAGAKDASPRTRPGPSIPESQDTEIAPRFGRAKRSQPGGDAFDLDAPTPRRAVAKKQADAEYEIPDDLVAGARRAAQAAALKAEERGSGSRVRRVSADTEASIVGEVPARRKRSFLIICAAVLLAISALLLYSRLRSKPEPEIIPPAAEQSAPAPSATSEGAATPGAEPSAPEAVEPKVETPSAPSSGSSELQPEPEASPAEIGADDAGGLSNFTDVAKSSYRQSAEDETLPQAQPASLRPNEVAALPPGVVLSVEDPAVGAEQQGAPAAPSSQPSMPARFALPPADLGPLPLRQAAAEGDARAQYAIALRYAEGQGTPQNLNEAVRWLERAASAGLAPAQYRLAVLYERGQGVAKDLGRARSWYQAAAEKGNVKAMHNLAVSASGRGGGAADYALASKWYGEAAAYGLASKWYGEAAAYGLADSQFNLGILAEHGLGMPKTLAEAYKWFALAAKNGDAEAAKQRDLVKQALDPASLAAAEQAIQAWTAKPAAQDANEVAELQEWADASSETNVSLVNHAQTLLNKLGYEVGVPDGLMGLRTRDAIKSFERRNGLEETGKVTIPLVAKLERLTS